MCECIDLSGQTPSMNTYIKHCSLLAQNRTAGLGMHENVYNTIIEDCVLAGATCNGTAIFKNCRFIEQNRNLSTTVGISYHATHDAKFARLTIEDCVFEGVNTAISLAKPYGQNAVRSYDSIIGEVNIIRCTGGRFYNAMAIDSHALSNTIERLNIDNWQNCYEIYFTQYVTINNFSIKDSTFLLLPHVLKQIEFMLARYMGVHIICLKIQMWYLLHLIRLRVM